MRTRSLALVAGIIVAVAFTENAFAQTPASSSAPAPAPAPAAPSAPQSGGATASEKRALAEMLFFTGRGLMEAKRYPEACVKFAESYRLDPAAGTLLNLAVCHESEGKIASAWGEFRQALFDARRMKRDDRETLAAEHIAKLEPDLPFLTLKVPPAVRSLPGLEIKRNGVAIAAAAWDTELPVDPGRVEIVAVARGYKPRTQTLNVAKQEHASLTLMPLEVAPIEVVETYWTPRRKVGLLFLGVGVAGVAVGSVAGIAAINDRKTSDGSCPVQDNERRCTTAGVDAMSRAKTAAWISDVGIGVGVASLALGSYLFFVNGSKEGANEPPKSARPLNVNVVAGPAGGQAILSGSF